MYIFCCFGKSLQEMFCQTSLFIPIVFVYRRIPQGTMVLDSNPGPNYLGGMRASNLALLSALLTLQKLVIGP
jgi:hypothetical protein